MATEGTLLGALGGYFGVLSSVQKLCFTREVFGRMGEDWPTEYNGIITSTLAAAAEDSRAVIRQLQEAKVGAEDRDAEMIDNLVSLVQLCLDETQTYSVPLTSAEGGMKGPEMIPATAIPWIVRFARAGEAVEVEAAATRKLPLGKWVKEALKWFFGIGLATGGGIILYRFWQSTDPMTMLNRYYEGQQIIQANHRRDVESCGDDQACIDRVNQRDETLAKQWGNAILPKPGSGDCGMLDTASGTLIGALLGVGFGWAGMRKIMRWS